MKSRQFLFILALALSLVSTASAAAGKVKVYSAASLTNVIGEIAVDYEHASGSKVITSFAASSALARQIEAGAPADIFISADQRWMDYLDEKGLIDRASRRNLLANELVLVAPKNESFAIDFIPDFDFAAALPGKLCMGEPEAVPAGTYGKEALVHLGWWSGVAGRFVGAVDVRAALAFVERGECAAGIVYRTDAQGSERVDVIGTFPLGSHSPIVYPAALVSPGSPAGRSFLEYLGSAEATTLFERHGFVIPSKAPAGP